MYQSGMPISTALPEAAWRVYHLSRDIPGAEHSGAEAAQDIAAAGGEMISRHHVLRERAGDRRDATTSGGDERLRLMQTQCQDSWAVCA